MSQLSQSVTGTRVPQDPLLERREYTTPRRLLYVEDTLATLEMVRLMLARRTNLDVTTAILGQSGLELARAVRPDMVVLDLHLPDIGGDEVMRQLLSDRTTREIPIVILSADATPNQLDRLLRLGARAYLTKPVSMRTLLETVDRHIEPLGEPVRTQVPLSQRWATPPK